MSDGGIPEDIDMGEVPQMPASQQEGTVQSAEESQTTQGAGQADEGDMGFQLEEDSEHEPAEVVDYATSGEGAERPIDEADEEVERNGYGQEYLTETGEDRYTSEQSYDEEEYDASQLNSNAQAGLTFQSGVYGAQAIPGQGQEGGSIMSQSYLTKSNQGRSGDDNFGNISSNVALQQLKDRIKQKNDQKNHVDPDEVVANLKGNQFEKIPLENERLDLFFRNNKFLSEFRGQTDQMAVHECYKAMLLKQFEKGRTIFRYGSTGDECFFIIKGTVKILQPQLVTIEVKTEQDLIEFYAEHYDEVIWEKIEDADEVKEMARIYKEDPEGIDFDSGDKEEDRAQDEGIQIGTGSPFERQNDKLPRAGSSLSKGSKGSQTKGPGYSTNFNFAKGKGSNMQSKASFSKLDGSARGSQLEVRSDQPYTEHVWLFKNMGSLGPGDCFAQADLIQSKPHQVTYQCTSDCEITCLSKEAYVRIVEKAVKRDFQGRIHFLKSYKIFSTMSQQQLEQLLYHVKLIEFERGNKVFKCGDKPDGVYLIQQGSFELSRPGHLSSEAEKIVNKINVDPMAKFQLRKQAKVVKDSSRSVVKLAILSCGEIFGLEECQVKPSSQRLKNRNYTVTCLERQSKAIFINHQAFADRVLYDSNVERAIKYESALKEFFHNSRELQYQQTVWNGSLTSIKQIESAAEKADADFEERLRRDTQGKVSEELKGMPRLRTIDQFLKDKFEAEVLNKIMDHIHERTADSLSDQDPEVKEMIQRKMKEVESHFEQNINVIDAERKQQRQTKEKLQQLDQIQKFHEEQYEKSVMASKAASGLLPKNSLYEQSLIQDSLMSSRGVPEFSQYTQSMAEKPPLMSHFASVDHENMKVAQAQVKQQRPLQSDAQIPQASHFQSIDQRATFNQNGRQQELFAINSMPVPIEAPSDYLDNNGNQRDSQKFKSRFGLNSDAQTIDQPAQASLRNLPIDQRDQPTGGTLPQTSGAQSDGVEFKGIQSSQHESNIKLVASATGLEKPETSTGVHNSQEGNQLPSSQQLQQNMNKTQDAFKAKDADNLLGSFEVQQENEEGPREKIATADGQKESERAAKGGIVGKQDEIRGSVDKKMSNITDLAAKIEQQSQEKVLAKDSAIKELSETTQNPSNLGNISNNIRDPRYSQEQSLQQKQKGGKKNIRGLITGGQRPFGLISIDQKIKIPKVSPEKDTIPVYQEGDEANEHYKTQGSNNAPPIVNITTKAASVRDDEQDQDNDESAHQEPETPEKSEEPLTEQVQSMLKHQGPLGSELPFNDYVTKSGLKGAKRNQIMNISKTLNDKLGRQKLKIQTKPSELNAVSPEQILALQSMQNSFTQDMPELFTEAFQRQNRHQTTTLQPVTHESATQGLFPSIHQSVTASQRQYIHESLTKETYLRNADISMIDTAQFTNDGISPYAGTPAGNQHELARMLDSHQSSQRKREVFVPSQINPLMKRQTGKSLAGKRKAQMMINMRGASAKSFETKKGVRPAKGRNNYHQKSFSYAAAQRKYLTGPQSPHAQPTPLQMPHGGQHPQMQEQNHHVPEMGASSRHPSLNQTSNSYAKQMQNPDDTQYQNAMMREAHQKQMMYEAARSAAQSAANMGQASGEQSQMMLDSDYDRSFGPQAGQLTLSPAAAAAASELIQRFITNPGEPISTEQFLTVQRKYDLPPFEAYQLLLQQIQFQKALLTPPTAATVIKVSHSSYTSAVRDKREEVISFRNDLFRRYTYRRRKSSVTSKAKKTTASIQTGTGDLSPLKMKK